MKKEGFTLIELLAVIVILAIIALILVPIVSGIIESARKTSFKESVNGIIDSTNNYLHDYILKHNNELNDYPVVFTCDGTSCKTTDNDVLTFKGNVPKSGNIVIQRDGVLAEYITDGKYCSYGYKWNLVVEDNCGEVDVTKPTITGTQDGKVVTLTMIDNASGIDKYCVTTDLSNCTWMTPTNAVNEVYTIPSAGTWYFVVKDNKGNISDSINFYVPQTAFGIALSNVKIGDYVSMTPSYVGTYTPTTDSTSPYYTGTDDPGTIIPSELTKWLVIRDIDTNGVVEMVSVNVSSGHISFYGYAGYDNLVGALNEIAKQYENSDYTSGSRNIGYLPGVTVLQGRTENDTNYVTDLNLLKAATAVRGTETVIATDPNGNSASYYLASRAQVGGLSHSGGHYDAYIIHSQGQLGDGCRNVCHPESAANGWMIDGKNVDLLYYRYSEKARYNVYSIRPILTLKNDILVNAIGDGSENNPWVLVNN